MKSRKSLDFATGMLSNAPVKARYWKELANTVQTSLLQPIIIIAALSILSLLLRNSLANTLEVLKPNGLFGWTFGFSGGSEFVGPPELSFRHITLSCIARSA